MRQVSMSFGGWFSHFYQIDVIFLKNRDESLLMRITQFRIIIESFV